MKINRSLDVLDQDFSEKVALKQTKIISLFHEFYVTISGHSKKSSKQKSESRICSSSKQLFSDSLFDHK
jgi:hypothetical protein